MFTSSRDWSACSQSLERKWISYFKISFLLSGKISGQHDFWWNSSRPRPPLIRLSLRENISDQTQVRTNKFLRSKYFRNYLLSSSISRETFSDSKVRQKLSVIITQYMRAATWSDSKASYAHNLLWMRFSKTTQDEVRDPSQPWLDRLGLACGYTVIGRQSLTALLKIWTDWSEPRPISG